MDIESIRKEISEESAAINSMESLEAFRVKYAGRKGVLAGLTASIPALPPDQRGQVGRQANDLKRLVMSVIEEKEKLLSSSACAQEPAVDLSLPGISREAGSVHPLTIVIDEICSVLSKMGFEIVAGPEVETEYNNFTGLNIPLEHPSREAFDTFYLSGETSGSGGKRLLRSHTSPMQVSVMKSRKPPLAVVVPGTVYRPDAADASHSFMFHQVEGFVVDSDIRFSHLKGVLETLAHALFGSDIKMRFRPHFFPFTEPSAEVDISCFKCKGCGCGVCGKKGWLEILGSGMIHPNVFKNVGYDPVKYSGFAFGMGVERIAMLKYSIGDIRLFYENDLRFLKQF